MEYRKRRRIRKKEARKLSDEIKERWGDCPFSEKNQVDLAEARDFALIFSEGELVGMIYEGMAFLTLKGILACSPSKAWVTVDMGAVKFLYNGADVMAPGIVDADPHIKEGDPVWIREETHKKPLAVGIALTEGEEMKLSDKGKAVKTIHYVGDKIWKTDE